MKNPVNIKEYYPLVKKHSRYITDQKKHLPQKRIKIKVLVAIPQKLYQKGLCSILKGMEDIIIREADGSWLNILMMVERMKPHVLVISLEMPSMVRTIFLSIVKDKFPNTRVLLIYSTKNDSELMQALSEGASGCVSLHSSEKELLKAVKNIYKGQLSVFRSLTGTLFKHMHIHKDSVRNITSKDKEIALLVSHGLSDKEIATQMKISFFTVREHIKHIYQFLGVKSRSQAIVKLLQTTRLP